jgi:hypothetical protein
VNVPLATLGVLLTYRTLVTGRHGWLATLALLACGLTKPSVLLIYASLPVPALLLWRSGAIPFTHLVAGGIAVTRAAVISYCVYYAWSPPRFFAGNPVHITLGAYASEFGSRLSFIWISYWGWLGWLDYALPTWWYIVMLVVVLFGAIAAAQRTTGETRRFAGFAVLFALGYFACMTVGEYWYLPMAGYNFQGRHLLPACIGFAGLVMSDSHIARWTAAGWLTLINVMLMHASIVRYFGGDWGVFLASLP